MTPPALSGSSNLVSLTRSPTLNFTAPPRSRGRGLPSSGRERGKACSPPLRTPSTARPTRRRCSPCSPCTRRGRRRSCRVLQGLELGGLQPHDLATPEDRTVSVGAETYGLPRLALQRSGVHVLSFGQATLQGPLAPWVGVEPTLRPSGL